MRQSTPCVGAKYRLDNETFIITSVFDENVSLCSLSRNTRRFLSLSDFSVMEYRGTLTKETPAPSELSDATRLITSEKDRQKYDFRRRYVQAYIEARESSPCSKEQTRKLIKDIAESLNDPHSPSVSTLYVWVQRYLQNNRNPLALLPHYPSKRKTRVQNTVVDLMKHYINTVYLTLERPSIQYAYRLLKGHINTENKRRERSDLPLLIAPAYCTFWRKIRNIDPYLTARSRNGERAAQRLFKHGRALYIDDDLFACQQYDTKRMDVEVCDENGNAIGRPILSAGINPATRECSGWDISMGSPCAEKLVSAVKRAIAGKEGIPNSGGKFRVCDVDNGAEFVNAWFQNIAKTLGNTIRYVPPGQPDAKAFIERFFRTVDIGLTHLLPGTTKGSPEELGDYKPRRHAAITLPQLREIFSTWLEIYHNTHHESLYMSPYQKRDELLKKSPPPERYSNADLDQLCRSMCYRVINNGRVTISNLSWTSPGVAEIGSKLGRSKTAIVYYDPCDLSEVWIAHRSSPKELIPAYATRPAYQHELTLTEHILVQKGLAEKKQAFDESLALQLRKDLHEDIQAIRLETKNKRKQHHQRKASGPAESESHPYKHSDEIRLKDSYKKTEIALPEPFKTFNLEDLRHGK
ncbi:DDE-type integrase/transposase/recombinase [Pseudomonas sp. AU12215]|uniref:DDE-type integrase/transposase/recombinase n=1 Tax=Pseudomonas sp. AU12215 TaxID=1860123 RepID=UPI00159EE2CE|nr:DDE-type integrase/transposase/recombinase [Pseudomonas sp. AU12215]